MEGNLGTKDENVGLREVGIRIRESELELESC
jgi:hypothetical protein